VAGATVGLGQGESMGGGKAMLGTEKRPYKENLQIGCSRDQKTTKEEGEKREQTSGRGGERGASAR